jgi:hypothetical protein
MHTSPLAHITPVASFAVPSVGQKRVVARVKVKGSDLVPVTEAAA